MALSTRWAFVSTALVGALGGDDRTGSKLYYDQRNGWEGFRRWTNLGGFAWIREYPDVVNAGTGIQGIFGADRLAVVSIRRLEDMENAAKSLGIREVMRF